MRILKQLTPAQKWVVALVGVTLALALGNLGRAVVGLRYAARLPDLPMTISLSYLAALGGFWGAVFLICALGLSRFRTWARWATLAAVTLYQGNIWANRLLFSASDYARQTLPRDAVLSTLLLIVFWGLLSLPGVRRAFDGGRQAP